MSGNLRWQFSCSNALQFPDALVHGAAAMHPEVMQMTMEALDELGAAPPAIVDAATDSQGRLVLVCACRNWDADAA